MKTSSGAVSERRLRVNWSRVMIWKSAVLLAIILLIVFLKLMNYAPANIDLETRPEFYGVTYSTKFATELDLDWQETYLAILDELGVKLVRIPIYWDEIEKVEGEFDFSRYDYLLDEGEKRGVRFIISLGRRTPRWPECHSPAWLNLKSDAQVRARTLTMVGEVVERYRERGSVEYWQVENEPFLSTFGVCPPLDRDLLEQEFALVRSLDDRPVLATASGELSFWKREKELGDVVGTTLYRVVYNRWFGFLKYPLPMSFYRLKGRLAGLPPERLMVIELQAEPWVPEGRMIYLNDREIRRSLSVDQFRANLQYAQDLGFQRAYMWGAEWWYFQKKYGNPEYWQIAARLFR